MPWCPRSSVKGTEPSAVSHRLRLAYCGCRQHARQYAKAISSCSLVFALFLSFHLSFALSPGSSWHTTCGGQAKGRLLMLASLPPSHADWRAAAASQGEAITRLFLSHGASRAGCSMGHTPPIARDTAHTSRVKHAMVSAQRRVWLKAADREPLPPTEVR